MDQQDTVAIEPARTAAAPKRRGRPLEMPPVEVLERIFRLARRTEGLFRIHHTHPDLYARARRQFGTWEAAVRAAGVDYEDALRQARGRSLETRRRRRRARTPEKTVQ